MKRLWLVAAKCVLIALVGFVFLETNDPFLMVGGSESTSFVVAPTPVVQAACVIGFAGALLVPATGLLRAALALLALVVLLIGSHRLVVDNLHNEIRDVYLGIPVQTLSLDPLQEGGLTVARSPGGLRIGQSGRPRTIWLFSPDGLGLDPTALSRLTG